MCPSFPKSSNNYLERVGWLNANDVSMQVWFINSRIKKVKKIQYKK